MDADDPEVAIALAATERRRPRRKHSGRWRTGGAGRRGVGGARLRRRAQSASQPLGQGGNAPGGRDAARPDDGEHDPAPQVYETQDPRELALEPRGRAPSRRSSPARTPRWPRRGGSKRPTVSRNDALRQAAAEMRAGSRRRALRRVEDTRLSPRHPGIGRVPHSRRPVRAGRRSLAGPVCLAISNTNETSSSSASQQSLATEEVLAASPSGSPSASTSYSSTSASSTGWASSAMPSENSSATRVTPSPRIPGSRPARSWPTTTSYGAAPPTWSTVGSDRSLGHVLSSITRATSSATSCGVRPSVSTENRATDS